MEEHTSKIIDGPYRTILSVVLFIQMSNSNLLAQMFPFFFLDPIVECDDRYRNPITQICDLDAMCNSNAEFIIDKSQTLNNWSSEMNLYCPRSSYKLVITTIYFVSCGIAPLIVSKLPDKYGRMRIFNILMIVMLVAFILLLFNSIFFHIISMAISGGLMIIYNVELQIVTEYYSSNVRGFITGLFCASVPFFGTLSIILFYYLHNITCLWWMLIITQVFCIAVVNIYFIESPLWLTSINRFEESLQYLHKVAMINNTKKEYEDFKKIAHIYTSAINHETASKEYSFKEILQYASIRKIVFAISPYWIAVLLFDFTLFLNLEKSNKNIYLQGIAVFFSCTISAFIAGYLADLVGRKRMLIISVFFSVIPFVFTPWASQNGYVYTETFLLFMSCIAIETAFTVIIIYVAEILPTPVRSTASGILYLLSRFGGIGAPYAVFFFTYPQYHVSIILLLSLYFIWDLPETKGMPLPTDIEENLMKNNQSLIPKRIHTIELQDC